jgi:septal ring factor EnvC (AmiA/AmiB activator)
VDLTELSAVGAVAVSVVTLIIVPYLRNRKKNSDEVTATNLASWQSFNAAVRKENEELRKQIKEMENENRQKFRELEAEYDGKMAVADARIKELENQVAALQARLYTQQNPPTLPPHRGRS